MAGDIRIGIKDDDDQQFKPEILGEWAENSVDFITAPQYESRARYLTRFLGQRAGRLYVDKKLPNVSLEVLILL
jgi:hypothetical protein